MLGQIGVVGVAVMGRNLILNMADHGFRVTVGNRTVSKVNDFLAEAKASEKSWDKLLGSESLEDFVAKLERPRKIMLMVQAGSAVDAFIEQLLPLLEPGDCIIDGGNSLFSDTTRRVRYLQPKGILFLGVGVSGGEEGARMGPSLMPGGDAKAWPLVKEIFQAISAKTTDGEACCDWVGPEGAGHFVKMVHNGIEYGDMQLICEAYQFMRDGLGMNYAEMQETFAEWNKGELDSYLIEITADILSRESNGKHTVEWVLDTAGQKGTGKWTGINALELGIPLTLIGEAVFARYISSMKEERVEAAEHFRRSIVPINDGRARKDVLEDLRLALLASKIVSYAQGYMLMRQAAKEYNWELNYGGIALMWRGGCIIRSVFLGKIKEAFDKNPQLSNLLLAPYFSDKVKGAQTGWRRVVAASAGAGIPVPTLSSALSFFDSYSSGWLPANLLQAQRDYFGSHTYERVDQPRGKFFHTDWIGTGEESPA
ncbi:decarboxylating NADP(+)-dependent phosphogluconate dehydrogenase [Candidatus Haliotispira prima]|uniref:6-phosphogluconate dehydrogenase, decarboxylating n=1 Tax=Candidatus Haliotispira prima TaxID=3034016 RepID=A0ABY8MLE4_9SPIO|nr:decarboxylating NADP(+)-dependent phosphogluconate dehydrogenase [Candidatus Haliotispira prima]